MNDSTTNHNNMYHSKLEMKITIADWNFGPGLGWAQKCGNVNLVAVNEITTPTPSGSQPPPPMLSRSTKAKWKKKNFKFRNFSKWPVLLTLKYYWLKF